MTTTQYITLLKKIDPSGKGLILRRVDDAFSLSKPGRPEAIGVCIVRGNFYPQRPLEKKKTKLAVIV